MAHLRTSRFLAGAAFCALLAGPTLAVGANAGIVSMHSAQTVLPFVKNGCHASGGVRVDPCTVTFTSSNAYPQVVTVRTPQSGGTLTETDDCASQGIATITPSGTNQYTVTPGPNAGTCHAHFRYYNAQGKKIGAATLNVRNQIGS